MMKKRILAVLICALMLLGFVGCTKNETPPPNNLDKDNNGGEGEPQDTEIDYTSHLLDADFEGYDFRIFIRPQKTSDQYVEEETADTVDDAVYRRNQIVADMYNITFSATESTSWDYETDALNTILAGDDAYDVIFPHSRAAFTYALQGALFNWHDIPNIDLSKPWWAKDVQQSCTINGKLYVMDGDISMHSLSLASGLVFNKNIFDELGLDYPYETVKDGKWTFDEFERLARLGSKDLNGDNVITPEEDRYGYTTGEWHGPITILYAGGQRIFTTNAQGVPQLSLNNERTVEIFDRFFTLLDSDDAFCKLSGELQNYDGPDHFRNGRAMMAHSDLGAVKNLREMEDEFGILPYPKFDETAEYATNINAHAHLVCVPTTAYSHIDKTGAILEALCAIGSREVIPAFYDVSLKTKFTRDDESSDMIDIIKKSCVYDLGYASGAAFNSVGWELVRSTNRDFASYYAQKESTALTKLQEFIEEYGKDR